MARRRRSSWPAANAAGRSPRSAISRSAQRAAVLPLVVGAVVARADRLPPRRVLAVPVDGPLQAVRELHLRLPDQRPDLVRGQRIAAPAARPVGDGLDSLLARARL